MNELAIILRRCFRDIFHADVIDFIRRVHFRFRFIHSGVRGTIDDVLNGVLPHEIRHLSGIRDVQFVGIGKDKSEDRIGVSRARLNFAP